MAGRSRRIDRKRVHRLWKQAVAGPAREAQRQIQTLYIDPGCPWQNRKDERFNGTVRDECLNMHLFGSVAEAQVRVEGFRQHYNHDRPHSRLGY